MSENVDFFSLEPVKYSRKESANILPVGSKLLLPTFCIWREKEDQGVYRYHLGSLLLIYHFSFHSTISDVPKSKLS